MTTCLQSTAKLSNTVAGLGMRCFERLPQSSKVQARWCRLWVSRAGAGAGYFGPCHGSCLSYALRACSGALLAGLKARASFMFTGCCWWRSLAVGGGSGTSRGHAPVMRRPDSRRRDAAARHPAPLGEPLVALGPLQVWLCTHAREVRLPEANTYARNMPPGANGVRDLLSAAALSWTFSMSVSCVIQDHPAHIP